MSFGLRLKKVAKSEIAQRVESAARILDISELLQRKPKQLSGGQRQRVAMGRAIVRDPKVFLFDEPLSNLDAKMRVQMRTEIKKVHQKVRTTTVYVTHDQIEAMTLADRVVVMNDGRIEQVGTPNDLYHFPATRFVAGFIGSPAMNFIEATLVREGGNWFIDAGGFRVRAPEAFHSRLEPHAGRQVIFGVRPEDIAACDPGAVVGLGNTVTARADVVETLGSEIFAYLTCGTHSVVARMEVPECPLTVGQTLDVELKMSKVHIFDKETSRTIV
jgi:multiple sugar transport system ATP-binding protein